MFKKCFILALLFAVAIGGLCAQNDTMRTVFKRDSVRYLGIYVAPEYQYSQSYGDFTSYTGGALMLIVNKRLAFGPAAYHLVEEAYSPTEIAPFRLRAGFGGLKVERTIRPNSAVHVGFSLLLGGGYASADTMGRRNFDHDHSNDNNRDFRNRGNTYFIGQPGLTLEANLWRRLKVFTAANYRFASKTSGSSALVNASALQGFGMSAGIKLGVFDWKVRKLRKPHIGKRK